MSSSMSAPQRNDSLVIGALVRAEALAIADEWRELCRWDPLLPPETQPPIAPAVLSAIADALDRPQALADSVDPAIEDVMEVFAVSVASVEVAVELLVCLRDVLRRRFVARIPREELMETNQRLLTSVDRAIGVAARHAVARQNREGLIDHSSGLLNRRALDWDLEREFGRAARYDRAFSFALLALVDPPPSPEERDRHLGILGGALRDALRTGDSAYRAGELEVALIFPETPPDAVEGVVERVGESGEAIPFVLGVVSFPDDASGADELIEVARARQSALRQVACEGPGLPNS